MHPITAESLPRRYLQRLQARCSRCNDAAQPERLRVDGAAQALADPASTKPALHEQASAGAASVGADVALLDHACSESSMDLHAEAAALLQAAQAQAAATGDEPMIALHTVLAGDSVNPGAYCGSPGDGGAGESRVTVARNRLDSWQ